RVRAGGPRRGRSFPGGAPRAEPAGGDGRVPRRHHRRRSHDRRTSGPRARLHAGARPAGGLMKLHHLRLTGIGPFADTVDIDLAALGASGMFLLEGPTGSGKSTILDAIVYALYGHVAGSVTSSERIRSQFASPTEPSVVDLVFETGSGIYRVRRQPEFQRPKLRGTGTTKEQAKAVLWRIGSPQLIESVIADTAGNAPGLEAIATRIDEVGREIQRAVGLSRDQFTQTVLLPQNEFARFLRAG